MLKKFEMAILVLCALSHPVFAQPPSFVVPPNPLSQAYRFEEIQIPGVTNFVPRGINDLGEVVGSARVNNRFEAVLYNLYTKKLEVIALVGSCSLTPTGINNWRQIVGIYTTGLNGICEPAVSMNHAFLRDWDGMFYDLPLVQGSRFSPQGINDLEKIVGSVVVDREQKGVIVRCLVNRWTKRLNCGEPSIFEIEGDQTFLTRGDDISGGGNYVGEFLDRPQGNLQHGFSCSARGKCIIIDFPGALGTSTTGVNDLGNVVGFWYGAAGGTHSFIAKINGDAVEEFTTIDPIGLGAVSSSPTDINNTRVVVGIYTDSSGALRPYVAWPNWLNLAFAFAR
jgi:hypothetical protein